MNVRFSYVMCRVMQLVRPTPVVYPFIVQNQVSMFRSWAFNQIMSRGNSCRHSRKSSIYSFGLLGDIRKANVIGDLRVSVDNYRSVIISAGKTSLGHSAHAAAFLGACNDSSKRKLLQA